MTRIIIPSLLAVTVLIAGIFAFMPVDQATAVHTSGTTTLGTGAINLAAVANDAITADSFVAGALDNDAFAVGALGTDEIATDAIDDAALAPNAIDAATFVAGSIDAAAIADNVQPFTKSITSVDDALNGPATCTSNQPYMVIATLTGANLDTISMFDGTTTYVSTFITGALQKTFTMGGAANTVWTFTGSAATVDGIFTLHTATGAAADCD